MSRGPWERRKPPEYYAAADFEKLQWSCGIPSRYWNTRLSSIHPSPVKYLAKEGGMKHVSASVQREYLTERVNNPELLDCNRLVCFTSCPTDEHALAAACLLASSYIEMVDRAQEAVKVRVDDIQDYEKALRISKDFYSTTPDVVILYNLNDNSPRERLTLVGDLLRDFEGGYRAIVVASDNPLAFAREKLYLEPQEVYHFEGKPRKVSSR